MPDLDRLVASLVHSDVPLERTALERHAAAIAPEVAPLAPATAVRAAVDALVGLGPLEPLLAEHDVTDVLVNGPDEVWIERRGTLERTDVTFASSEDIVATVRRAIASLGLRIDRASPAVDARLPDGSRLHALIPPASVDTPVVAIRRFIAAVATIDDLVDHGAATPDDADRLRQLVDRRANVLVTGATGSGKTTLLNALLRAVPPTDRVVTVEDASELAPSGHVVRLEAHPANTEGMGGITVRSLLRHALRLRPDRIVVGEVRGPEALDMIAAMATGHRGSMSTIHAHTTAEAMARLRALAAMAPDAAPHDAIADLVSGSIDAVVAMDRDRGVRRIRRIDVRGDEGWPT